MGLNAAAGRAGLDAPVRVARGSGARVYAPVLTGGSERGSWTRGSGRGSWTWQLDAWVYAPVWLAATRRAATGRAGLDAPVRVTRRSTRRSGSVGLDATAGRAGLDAGLDPPFWTRGLRAGRYARLGGRVGTRASSCRVQPTVSTGRPEVRVYLQPPHASDSQRALLAGALSGCQEVYRPTSAS